MYSQKVSEVFKLYVITMDWNKCISCQSDSKNLLDPSKTLNQRVCGYTLLMNNIEKFITEGIALPKKITVDLNYRMEKIRT